MGHTTALGLFQQTPAEEKATDDKPTALVEGSVNIGAEMVEG